MANEQLVPGQLPSSRPGSLHYTEVDAVCNRVTPPRILFRKKWTTEEDDKLIRHQNNIWNNWSLITDVLPGRTKESVWNRWYSTLKNKYKLLNPFPSLSLLKEENGVGEQGAAAESEGASSATKAKAAPKRKVREASSRVIRPVALKDHNNAFAFKVADMCKEISSTKLLSLNTFQVNQNSAFNGPVLSQRVNDISDISDISDTSDTNDESAARTVADNSTAAFAGSGVHWFQQGPRRTICYNCKTSQIHVTRRSASIHHYCTKKSCQAAGYREVGESRLPCVNCNQVERSLDKDGYCCNLTACQDVKNRLIYPLGEIVPQPPRTCT